MLLHRKKRLPTSWAIAAMVIMVVAYQVIEPFRVIRYQDPGFQNRNIVEIAQVMGDIALDSNQAGYGQWIGPMMQRMNYTVFAARSIAFKEEVGLDHTDPDFVERMILSPLYAYIPRLIWTSKPYANLGRWYNVKVFGRPETTVTSVAMSPVGYLYFAGGVLGVFLGFVVIGVFQRLVYEAFARAGGGGWVVYLGVLYSLVVIGSDVGGIFTTVFRFVPIMLVGQYFLFRGRTVTGRSGARRVPLPAGT